MGNDVIARNHISLPTFGAELFTYLKDNNDHESFTASMRLKDVLSEHLKREINSWFVVPALPELDRTLLRRITNSLLSAGVNGSKRTKDALSELRLEAGNMSKPMDLNDATEYLRDWSRDFRSAKGFLDHQYKCINSFLRVQKTTNDETVRQLLKQEIRNLSDFKDWQIILEKYWDQKGIVKPNLRNSYENIFHSFMASFDEEIQNDGYPSYLDQHWQRYLDPSAIEISLNSFNKQSKRIKNSEDLTIRPSFEIDLRIEDGKIFYQVLCNSLNDFQASELRFKLALGISKNPDFAELKFSVSLIYADVPIIMIRTDGMSDEVELSRMVTLLEELIEKSKLPG